MPSPAVTVVVGTYNQKRFVRECLDSVRAQTSQDFELIIIDDASRDGTADMIRAWLAETGYHAHFVHNAVNQGLCANFNTSLTLAAGRFVCFLSGDDAFEPDRIERQLQFIDNQPETVAAVFSDARIVDADGSELYSSLLSYHLGSEPVPSGTDLFARLLLKGNFIPMPATMIRRRAIELVGLVDDSLYYEDYQLWLKLSHRFQFHYLSGHLAKYRLLPHSMSRNPANRRAMVNSEFRILSAWLGRCGEANQELIDRLWGRGYVHLDYRLYTEARAAFAFAAQADGGALRRVAAGLLHMPGVPHAVTRTRQCLHLARRVRNRISRGMAARSGARAPDTVAAG